MSHGKRQTISYLTKRFEEVGLYPNKKHGQNFLIDLNIVELLARAADLGPNDVVLEVGTGTGGLTDLLADKAAKVVTVEIDHHLHQLAREELEQHENIVMLLQDALKNKNKIHPTVMETVQDNLAGVEGSRFKVAANLPYNIATPLISNLMATEIVPDTLTVTIQKELADRIMAKPRTKDYSSLSIWMQSLCDIELVRVLPPSVFWPRPKVDSAIIHIIHRPEKRARIADLGFYHEFVRALFFHRRKFLRSVLISAFKNRLEKSHIDQVMSEMELGAEARAEEQTVETILDMSERFRQLEIQVKETAT